MLTVLLSLCICFHIAQCLEEDGIDDVKMKMIAQEEGNTRNEDVSNNDHCATDGLV